MKMIHPVLGRVHDLPQIAVNDDSGFLLAMETAAGVGPLAEDLYPSTERDLGYFAARIVIMKLLAARGEPFFLYYHLGIADANSRQLFREGIEQFLEEIGESHLPINDTMAPAFTVPVTGVGITLVGTYNHPERPDTCHDGDELYLIGHPRRASQNRFMRNDTVMPSVSHLKMLSAIVHEMVPVGKEGVMPVVEAMAAEAGMDFVPSGRLPQWLWQEDSLPTSALVVAISPEHSKRAMSVPVPVTRIGTLKTPAMEAE